MKPKSPIILLIVGAALAAGLLGANLGSSGDTAATTAGPVERAGAAASSTAASSTAGSSRSVSPAASATAATAAAPAKATAVATYAGTVTGSGSLAVVVKGSSVVAYLCDGRNEAWLWGTANGAKVSARDKTGDTLDGTRGGGKLTGSLTVRGSTWSFALPSVKKPSGLYRATAQIRGAKVVGGWVVLPDGRQVGALSRNGTVSGPAPAVDPATGAATVDGAPLTATEPDPAAGPDS